MKSSLIQNDACVEANVKVAPDVKIKNIQTCFVGDPVVEACAEHCPESSYTVSQMLCIKYSLSFSADVQATPTGITCNQLSEEDQPKIITDYNIADYVYPLETNDEEDAESVSFSQEVPAAVIKPAVKPEASVSSEAQKA
ncbi:MAG: hypothetical protein WCP73_08495, partial [Eubacteriales bacterium]